MGLHIREVGLATTFSLSPLVTNDAIHDTKHEVANPSTMESFPDIKHLAKRFNEFGSFFGSFSSSYLNWP